MFWERLAPWPSVNRQLTVNFDRMLTWRWCGLTRWRGADVVDDMAADVEKKVGKKFKN